MTPGVLQATYSIYVYNTTGTQVAVLTDWTQLQYRSAVNEAGSFQITFAEPSGVGLSLDSLPALFPEDAIVVIRRAIPDAGTDWYTDFTGLTRDTSYQRDERGNLNFVAKGVGCLDLVARRVVAYAAGTKFTEKRAASDTAIVAFVEENCCASATVVNGRYASGVTANLTATAATGFGATWTGARHMQNVLAIAQDISVQMADVEFSMATTVGGGAVAFVFSTVPRIGTNRASTVTFSTGFGNMAAPQNSTARTQAKNRAYVLGPGEKADRLVITANSVTLQAGSPWALTEMTREATQDTTGASLSNLGAAVLEGARPFVQFAFTPIETPATRYGVQYFLGDTVTAITEDGTSLTLRVIGVTINSAGGDSGAETINLDIRVLR